MKIAVGADHGGWKAKDAIVKLLRQSGHRVADLGTVSDESVDYPDFARKVALLVSRGRAERGILFCGTGIGMSIAANKVRGIRAAVAWNPKTAELAAEHNGANVLCLSGRFIRLPELKKMVKVWLKTPFGGGRHQRRIDKISKMEIR